MPLLSSSSSIRVFARAEELVRTRACVPPSVVCSCSSKLQANLTLLSVVLRQVSSVFDSRAEPAPCRVPWALPAPTLETGRLGLELGQSARQPERAARRQCPPLQEIACFVLSQRSLYQPAIG